MIVQHGARRSLSPLLRDNLLNAVAVEVDQGQLVKATGGAAPLLLKVPALPGPDRDMRRRIAWLRSALQHHERVTVAGDASNCGRLDRDRHRRAAPEDAVVAAAPANHEWMRAQCAGGVGLP